MDDVNIKQSNDIMFGQPHSKHSIRIQKKDLSNIQINNEFKLSNV